MALFTSFTSLSLFAQDNNTKNPLEEKIKDLISQMTLEEKVGLTVGDGRFLPTASQTAEKNVEVPIANRNSKMLIPRLSIKTTALTDGPAGINKHAPPVGATEYTYTTSFPTSTCLAATWNTEMVEKVPILLPTSIKIPISIRGTVMNKRIR